MKTNNHMIARAGAAARVTTRETLAVNLALQFWKSAQIRQRKLDVSAVPSSGRYPTYFSPFEFPPSQ